MSISQSLFLIVWLAFMYVISQSYNVCKNEYVLGKKVIRVTVFFAILVFVPIIWQAAYRGNFGDSLGYAKTFRDLPTTFSELIEHIPTVKKDKGFTLLSGLIRLLIGPNSVGYFAIIAMIQSACLISVFRKYSINYLISIFLFVASTDYLSWMFNGIRQFTAVTLIFGATGLILRKKWVAATLVILLASTMHQSALLMFIIILIAQGKAWNFRSIFFLIVALAIVRFSSQFIELLDEMMQETQYSNAVSDWEYLNDDGTNALRVLVYAVPTLLSIVGIKYIRHADDPIINLCTNMSIVSTGIYIISMFTSGIYIGRLPIYASLYNYILLPWEIQHIFAHRTRHVLYICMIGAYLIFLIYQLKFAWGF